VSKSERLYSEKKYDQALQGFLDAQVERPDDPFLRYDAGSAQYRLNNFADAEKSFASVAASGEPLLEQKATYNLGNCAYRQGKLEEAVAHYQKALELDPRDEDARSNLEFVRQEIKRRLEEAGKQQGQQQQQEQKQAQEGQQQGAGERQQEQNRQGSQSRDQPPGQEQQGTPQAETARPEERGEQPPGEAGKSPEASPGRQEPQTGQSLAGASPGGEDRSAGAQGGDEAYATAPSRSMTPEEAERWLNTLDEDQKELARKQAQQSAGRGERRPSKDW